MSSSKEQIRESIVSTVNAHLDAHKQAKINADNWTKIIGGCKSANVAKGIADQYGIKEVPALSEFTSLDAAVDYVFKSQA